MKSKLAVDIFPKCCFSLKVCNSVRIVQNLLNEVPVQRSILADFGNYHLILNSLNGKLTGSRKDNLHWSMSTKND